MTYIYIYTYTHIYIYIHICLWVSEWVSVCVCVYQSISNYMATSFCIMVVSISCASISLMWRSHWVRSQGFAETKLDIAANGSGVGNIYRSHVEAEDTLDNPISVEFSLNDTQRDALWEDLTNLEKKLDANLRIPHPRRLLQRSLQQRAAQNLFFIVMTVYLLYVHLFISSSLSIPSCLHIVIVVYIEFPVIIY